MHPRNKLLKLNKQEKKQICVQDLDDSGNHEVDVSNNYPVLLKECIFILYFSLEFKGRKIRVVTIA